MTVSSESCAHTFATKHIYIYAFMHNDICLGGELTAEEFIIPEFTVWDTITDLTCCDTGAVVTHEVTH